MTKINRIYSEPPRDNAWLDYHREMRTKHRYFVRGDKIKPYYSDSPFESITEDIPGAYIEVIDWHWRSNKWNEMPYMYRIIPNGDKYKYFARENTAKDFLLYNRPAGVKKNGEWFEMHYINEFASFFWAARGFCSVRYGALFNRQVSGKWYIWTGSNELVRLKSPPIDELLPLVKRMNAKKQRNFYEPVIDFLVNEGLGRSQL